MVEEADDKGCIGLTYITLRPRYAVGDPFSTTKIRQKVVSYEKIGEERPRHMVARERTRNVEVPNIRKYRGLPQKTNLLHFFGNYAYDYDVRIGIDSNSEHVNYRGDSVNYGALFGRLREYGFDPLAPLRDDDTRRRFEYQLGAYIYSEIQSVLRNKEYNKRHDDNRPLKNIRNAIRSWATIPRDYVRDYIRGIVAPVPKNGLADSTIRRRKYTDAPYRYGIGEALWETGELESNIKVLEIKATKRFSEHSRYLQDKLEREERKKRARKRLQATEEKDEPTKRRPSSPTPRNVSTAESMRILREKYNRAKYELYRKDTSRFKMWFDEFGEQKYAFIGNTDAERKRTAEYLKRKYPKEYGLLEAAYKEVEKINSTAKTIVRNISSRG